MDVLFELQSLILGLMGWAATVLALEGASRLTVNDRRAMAVCCWVLWMAPAFGALVLNGVLNTDTAALYVGLTTGAVGVIVLLGAIGRPRTRP
ncbi:MAG TPA: hypothetical protein PKD53_02660 [Chloroflexaceae bacterium]|nr:hypothetical protein [Chloroflexaceae bacterium]